MRRQAREVFGQLTWIAPLIAMLVLSSCSSAPTNGTPFGPTVSERVLLVGIVDRLEEHGSFRFRWSGEVVDPVAGFEDDSRVAPLSTRPAEGQARSDLSRWWSMRYPSDTEVSDFRIVGWSELARYEQATASNSHDLERTCRVPFKRFTTDQCLLFFGDFSGLWRSNDLNRTLSELARREVADRIRRCNSTWSSRHRPDQQAVQPARRPGPVRSDIGPTSPAHSAAATTGSSTRSEWTAHCTSSGEHMQGQASPDVPVSRRRSSTALAIPWYSRWTRGMESADGQCVNLS